MTLDFSYAHSCKLLLPAFRHVHLIQVGAGGTGSWLFPHVARTARLLIEKFQIPTRVLLIDGDRVEAKNVFRQNFSDAEVGRNKAQTLALRYGAAWGVEVTAVPRFLDELFQPPSMDGWQGELEVWIGCVDNHLARRCIAGLVRRADYHGSARSWWLDCGNGQSTGQVLLGCQPVSADPFVLPGFCAALPLPSVQHPELLDPEIPAQKSTENVQPSCGDQTMIDEQGLSINAMIASLATNHLFRMLLTKDLMTFATYVDLSAGVVRSKYITRETLVESSHEPLNE